MRNAYGQTAVAPYSVRAFPGAPVAMPLVWHDLERGLVGPRTFTIGNFNEYLQLNGDPWIGMAKQAHSIKLAHKRMSWLAGLSRSHTAVTSAASARVIDTSPMCWNEQG